MTELLRTPISLGPVLVFLAALIVLDSYQLVPLRSVLQSAAAGVAAALLCLLLNVRLIELLGMDPRSYARHVAPLLEEAVKALWIVLLVRRHRLGFTVDAAIHGFAVGAGFAVVENVYYLVALEDPGLIVWIVRGFGTAMLHGSTAAIFAMVAKNLADRRPGSLLAYVPALAGASLLHLGFNQFVLPPVLATILMLAVLPFVVTLVFQRSERVTREWLGSGFDADVEILELIDSGEFRESRIGQYLESLRTRFPPAVVGDMFCMLQIHHELAIRAKALLLAREAGVEIPTGERVKSRLDELAYLEKSIGRTGKLALAPLLAGGGRHRWQLTLLEGK